LINNSGNIPAELAPCGVFCGSCPSYKLTCLGCPSENKNQKRTSKWGCKVRTCCYTVQNKNFCIECDQFPCNQHRKKLLDSHPGDPRFKYRHEILDNFKKLKELGIEDYLEYQRRKWACPSCGGLIYMYHYKCSQCGKHVKHHE
jgi:hypothetical protein